MDKRKERVVAKVNEGVWCLVRMPGRAAFARLQEIKQIDDSTRGQMEGCLKNNTGLKFDVVLDYFSPIRPVPVVNERGDMQIDPRTRQPVTQMGREAIVTNFEFVMDPCPMKLFNIECCIPLQDMTERDKNMAEQLIEDALKTLEMRRAGDSGLVLPTANQSAEAALSAAIQKALAEGGPLPPGVTREADTPDGKPHFKVDLRKTIQQQ